MYNPRGQLSQPTSLGISERWERVLCYALMWVSGLIMLFLEPRNRTVRRHAVQSVIVFGAFSLVLFLLGLLLWIPVLNLLVGVLIWVVRTVMLVSWVGLMLAALVSPVTFLNPRRPGYL